jgi:general stress protein 26
MTHHDNHDDMNRQKARAMLEEIGTVMLVTHEQSGGMQARPMQILAIEGNVVWFFTDVNSPKSMQIGQDQDVLLAASCPERKEYVSVAGRARVMQDIERQRHLWTEDARPWFPEGARSEDLALICVTMEGAEFWASERSGGAYAYSYVQAMQEEAGQKDAEHAKVKFEG